jgi:hypothetical protein
LLEAGPPPYLKIIDALVIPGAVALYVIPERFGLIGDCSPGFRVTCCALHETVVALGSVMTFLLKVIDSGEVHVPLANEIVAVELLNTMARRLNVLPTAIFDGAV